MPVSSPEAPAAPDAQAPQGGEATPGTEERLYCSACNCRQAISQFKVINGKRRKTCNKHEKKRPLPTPTPDAPDAREAPRESEATPGTEEKLYCSGCCCLHAISQFKVIDGKRRKTCARRENKKPLPAATPLAELRNELLSWRSLENNETQDVKYLVNLDELPFPFEDTTASTNAVPTDRLGDDVVSENGNPDAFKNSTMALAKLTFKLSGYRFYHNSTDNNADTVDFRFYCCQDAAHAPVKKEKYKRDRRKMKRFDCNSSLSFRVVKSQRALLISLRHRHHPAYVDIRLSREIRHFIDEKVAAQSPSAIHKALLQSRLPSCNETTESQVYYRWKKANKSIWARDDNAYLSAKIFLKEHFGDEPVEFESESKNCRGLVIFVDEAINKIATSTKEVAIDATYGTNNAGMSLFAVLAELDGMGVPLAYMFQQSLSKNTEPSALTQLIVQFLTALKKKGLNPTFFGCDKDNSEINAIREVYPGATIQLCLWHAKRAVRARLVKSGATFSQSSYSPEEAQLLVPEIEVCWGSLPTRRSNGPHRYGRCDCPSRGMDFSRKAKLGVEASTQEDKDAIVDLFNCHFNKHPLLPDADGNRHSAAAIHRACATQMYRFCRERNYYRIWAYMFTNWYNHKNWNLWARCANPEQIPVLKTTMIVESHWRLIKHDYLHNFNRPRIDLVSYILLSQIVPNAVRQMNAVCSNNLRVCTPSWRKDFKSEWKDLSTAMVDTDSLARYHTDPVRWTCGCKVFANSRFLICKHLVYCHKPISDIVTFIDNVKRQKTCPFWTNEFLVIKQQYRTGDVATVVIDDDLSDSFDDIGSGGDNGSNDGSGDDDDHEGALRFARLEEKLNERAELLVNTIREQAALGNERLLDGIDKAMRPVNTLIDDIMKVANQRTMPRTWDKGVHPSVMFYQHPPKD